jgi:hypothetical protein
MTWRALSISPYPTSSTLAGIASHPLHSRIVAARVELESKTLDQWTTNNVKR